MGPRRNDEPGGRHRVAVATWVLVLALAAAPAAAVDTDAIARSRGWGYLVDKLANDGVGRARAAAAFADPRVPPFDGLPFSLVPREASAPYRSLQGAASVRAARRCHARFADAFAAAEARERVPASLVAAIIHVESGCGENTGSSGIFHRLARLAMANEPANLAWNVRRLADEPFDPSVVEKVQRRARYLEDTFYPEVRALFTIADQQKIDPLGMQGSAAGAFGYPQFLPTSFLRFGVDGDGDGRVSLYSMPDAAVSCARYLSQFGWTAHASLAEKRSVIWHYNRSDVYIDTVLALERRIRDPQDPAPQVARNSRRRARR